MEANKFINAIIHEVNVAHSINCNQQARYHIGTQCRIMRNQAEKKWNELGFWLNNNPDAKVEEIHQIREILNEGKKSVRGFTFDKQ